MRKLISICVAAVFAVPFTLQAQQNIVFVSYQSSGYKYQAVKSSSPLISNFQNPGFNDASWSNGSAGFGTTTLPNTPPCPLNDVAFVRTDWPQSRDLLIRRVLSLPAGTKNLRVGVAIDNLVQVFFDGKDISGGLRLHDECAAADDFVFTVPDSLVKAGSNVLAVRGMWASGQCYVDMNVVGDVAFTITASAGPNGTITPSGSIFAIGGSSRSFTIQPEDGYHVDSVIVDGLKVDSTASFTFSNISANHSIRVVFAVNTYPITSSSGPNGAITPSGVVLVPHGASQSFRSIPDAGYHQDSLIVDGIARDTAYSFTFSGVTGPHSIRSTFAINTYTIVAASGPNGRVTPDGTSIVPYGSRLRFLFTPDAAYHVDSVLVDEAPVDSLEGYTFENVQANHSVRVVFALNYYSLSVDAQNASLVIEPAQTTYAHGTTVQLSVDPDRRYHFLGWQGDAQGNDNPLTVLMDRDRSITATVVADTPFVYTVTELTDAALREAITSANAHPGADTIRFGSTGTIRILSALPSLTDETILDGVSQAASGSEPQVVLMLDASAIPDAVTPNGLELLGGYSTVRGLLITGFTGAGIVVRSDSNRIAGNVIRENAGDGIRIEDGSGNVLGGLVEVDRNVVEHNGGTGVAVRHLNGTRFPSGNAIKDRDWGL